MLSSILSCCQETTPTETAKKTTDLTDASAKKPERKTTDSIYLYAIVDKLRIREQPNTNSKVVASLKLGEHLLYLNEETTLKDTIEIRGKTRIATWKKVKYQANNFSKPKEAWLYGGGVITPSDKLEAINDSEFVKIIQNVSYNSLTKMLGIEIDEPLNYHGLISYKQSNDGKYIKQGPFAIHGKSEKAITDLIEFQSEASYSGVYDNDLPNGLFHKHRIGYEDGDETHIQFKDGKCLWANIDGQSEGEHYRAREQNPPECTFSYIYAQAKK